MPKIVPSVPAVSPLVVLLLTGVAIAQSYDLTTLFPFPVVAAGDVDGDGIADYATIQGGITVYRAATGLPILHLASTKSDRLVPVGDTDGDGCDDLAFVDGSEVLVVSGRDGTVLHTWVMPAEPDAIAGTDLDGDGWDDVVLDYELGSNHVIEVRSGRTGALLWDRSSTAPQWSVLPGDHDGDGHADLAVLTLDPVEQTWTAEILRGPSLIVGAVLDGDPFFLGDVDGNGAVDHTRRIELPTTATEVRDGADDHLIGSFPWHPVFRALGDVDGDGRADFRLQGGAFREVLGGGTLTILPGINMSVLGLDVQRLGDIDGDGRSETSVPDSGQVIEWTDPAAPAVSRMLRRGAAGTTSLGTKPRLRVRGHCKLGDTVRFDMPAGLPFGFTLFLVGNAIDADLAFLGAPDNRLYVDLLGITPLLTDAAGLARLDAPIPFDPSLLASTISAQCAVFDTLANPFGFVTSNAVDIHILD
ncbi:MAG: VCBS repeat-containing protein [Planctomycetes bacterium]|nr:VCBS repeat-containing protein [Planctomycetota bacterium]